MNVIAFIVKCPPVNAPLVQDTECEIAKDGRHEQNLGHKFEPNEHLVLKVDVVVDLQADTKGHLQGKID